MAASRKLPSIRLLKVLQILTNWRCYRGLLQPVSIREQTEPHPHHFVISHSLVYRQGCPTICLHLFVVLGEIGIFETSESDLGPSPIFYYFGLKRTLTWKSILLGRESSFQVKTFCNGLNSLLVRGFYTLVVANVLADSTSYKECFVPLLINVESHNPPTMVSHNPPTWGSNVFVAHRSTPDLDIICNGPTPPPITCRRQPRSF